MSEDQKQAVVTTEKPAKVKKEKVQKEPRFSSKWTPEKWAEHIASLTKPEVPEGYLGMAEIVKAARVAEIKTSRICAAMGGDRAANPPWEPLFQVVYVGGRKYGSPEILTKGFELLKNADYHKQERKGRPKLEKLNDPKTKKSVTLKAAPGFNRSDAWTAPKDAPNPEAS